MLRFHSSDGFVFHRHSDGVWRDSIDIEDTDLSFNSGIEEWPEDAWGYPLEGILCEGPQA